MAWLKTSPVHVEEYLATVALAGDLKTAASTAQIPLEPLLARARTEADNVVTLDQPLPEQALTMPRHRGSPVRWLAAAAVLVFVAMAALWLTRDGERFGLPRTYRTAHGEQSRRVLPDGSVLNLNTDSQVTVHYSRRERVVDLDRGQAFFQVRHEGARAFRVSAGNAQIVDVGTQFDVYRRPGTVLVSVFEGTVAVYTGPPQLTPNARRRRLHCDCRPATRSKWADRLDRRGRWTRAPPARGCASRLPLRTNRWVRSPTNSTATGSIAIEIDDKALRSVPITGVFDAYDTDSFVAFLATLNDVVVQKTATRIRVFKRAATPREPAPNAK